MTDVFDFFYEFLIAHFGSLLGFLLAVFVIGHMFNERRTPSNIFAWALIVIFVPYIGAPLYFLFGGRKSRRLVENKKAVLAVAHAVAQESGQPNQDMSISTGNSFRMLNNGEEAYAEMYRSIENSRESIHIMTYILGRDETGRSIVELLTRKAREGVEVRLMIDAVGSLGSGGKFLQPLREAGGHVARFMPVLPMQTKTSANLRNHRKIAVFDCSKAIIGGQNIDTRFLGKEPSEERFHDCSAAVEGPVVRALHRVFLSDWCFASGDDPNKFRRFFAYQPAPAGDNTMEMIAGGPDLKGDPLWERYLSMVQDCEREMTIVTPYFVPDEVLFQSLIVKAHSGRRIRLILPERSNQKLVDFARGHYLRKLVEAGVDVLLYQPRMLHAKVMIVDGKQAVLGSANLDMRSLFVNFEIALVQTSKAPIAELQAWVNDILPDCIHYKDMPVAKAGANRRVMEDFAHLVTPLL